MKMSFRRVLCVALVCACALAAAPAALAAGWTAQTSGTVQNLWGVDFVDSVHGWAVGDTSVILTTINGGATWSPQTWPGLATSFYAVDFVDTQHGWAVGSGGVIAATANGGATWSSQPSGTVMDLAGVNFVDAQHGWVTGDAGLILATSDGGATWTLQSAAGPPPGSLIDLDFVDLQHGWIAGMNGAILATANGGATWTPQTSGTANGLYAIDFIDQQHGWATGDGIILATTNGGASWVKQSGGGVWQYLTFLDVAATSPQTAWLAGQWALIGSTVNAGATWNGQIVGEQILGGISFVGNQHGWTVGNLGVIYATWAPQSSAHVIPAPNKNGWNGTPVTVDFSSTTMAGYQVDEMQFRLGDGPWLPAAEDGSGWKTTVTRNGVTDVGYRGTDSAGNVEDPLSVTVRVDTKKPVPMALAKATVKKGRKATLRYRVNDVTPTCAVAISVRNARGKRVKQFKIAAAPTNVNATLAFTCRLKKGTYTWKVAATDLAGNKQAKSASATLLVK
jgi:photosystem II stability/assembly factor-like uncharacterized protein